MNYPLYNEPEYPYVERRNRDDSITRTSVTTTWIVLPKGSSHEGGVTEIVDGNKTTYGYKINGKHYITRVDTPGEAFALLLEAFADRFEQ